MWKPREGKVAHVFAPTEVGIDNNHETAINALNNARVKSVTCLEYTSTFPIPLGIKCDSLPACESTDIGHRYIMTTLPNHSNTTPLNLYTADDTSSEAVRWKQEYPQYTSRNIDTHNVMEVKTHPVMFVDKDHPVISLLRANKAILGSDIDEQSLVQGRWHTVSRQCFNTACKTLRTKVLSNINTVNLSNFSLQATPLDRKSWCDIGKGEHVKEIVEATTREAGILPSNDPGNYGGGAFMGTSTTPTQNDFEGLFGPAGRDVRLDEQRHKRHQRWHLPDVLKGANTFLTDRVDGLISDATGSPFTSTVLPYQYVENPDQKLQWDVWSYDEGLASRVPYESAARVLTQTKSTHSAYIVRQGLAISMEHNFMMSERGRRDFNNQLLQLVGSIQYTNDLDVHMALITAPNYERTEIEKYAYSDSDPYSVLRKYVDMYGMCQKNPNGLDVLIEDAKQVFKKWGASDPTFMMCNSKLGYQQNMTLEKTQYVTNGIDGVKRLRDGPDLKSYRGLSVIHSRHFSMETGRQPRDLLNRRVRVAEYYKLPAMTITEIGASTATFYDEGADQMKDIPCKELFVKSTLKTDTDSFDHLLRVGAAHARIPSEFWKNLFYNPDMPGDNATLGEEKFKSWLKLAPTHTTLSSMYHPLFVGRFVATLVNNPALFVDNTSTRETKFNEIMKTAMSPPPSPPCAITDEAYLSGMGHVFDMTPQQIVEMRTWLLFAKDRHKDSVQTPHDYKYAVVHKFCGWSDTVLATAGAQQYKDCIKYFVGSMYTGHRMAKTSTAYDTLCADDKMLLALMYSLLLPHTARVYDGYSDQILTGDPKRDPSAPKQYTLYVVRPSIEHYMLGIIVGRGGTGELGATLWGQTELSCYDDAMHGKWGMNYKYHARAVVFNEKHLLRLWDVAFNGYTGGGGTKLVDWNDDEKREKWKMSCVSLDEPLKVDAPDMFVMRFETEDSIDVDVPNPINFCYDHEKPANQTHADPENIHNAHVEGMDIWSNMTDDNTTRYRQYFKLMPNFARMHAGRKTAGHASHEGDTHAASLAFAGTMTVTTRRTDGNDRIRNFHGTGHLGDSYPGVASIRAGNGSMAAVGRPETRRLV
ncbi:hypothetical protein T484DRAFT_1845253 [Baffinella frigidus]|nr:hypothetical protein T484DRAFT_1845253 [Cryptophyta sp. CCMP2293]